MREAIRLAEKGKGFTSPNPCVGALVVKDGVIVGKGYHQAAGSLHAEPNAINDAGEKSRGATLFVTLEPCNHTGRTPPCTHKIIEAGIRKVVVGCLDPNPFVAGGGIQYLKENNIEVVSQVLEDQASRLIEDFIWYVQNDRRPFVILKCASTLDGRIATASGDSKWITNEASRAFGHRLRHEADAILVGSGTLHADDPSLTARLTGEDTRDPVRVILDTHLTIDDTARVLNLDSVAQTIVICGPDISEDKKGRIERKGARVMQVGLKNQRLDLNEVMIKLGQLSILSLLIEGGGTVAGAALAEKVVNKVCFFLAPKILGGSDGIPVISGKGPSAIDQAHEIMEPEVTRLGGDILVQGYLK